MGYPQRCRSRTGTVSGRGRRVPPTHSQTTPELSRDTPVLFREVDSRGPVTVGGTCGSHIQENVTFRGCPPEVGLSVRLSFSPSSRLGWGWGAGVIRDVWVLHKTDTVD